MDEVTIITEVKCNETIWLKKDTRSSVDLCWACIQCIDLLKVILNKYVQIGLIC